MLSEDEVRAIKRRHSARLLQQPGVCGVGVEKDEAGRFVLAVHVDGGDPAAGEGLPGEIEGVPVRVVRSGPFGRFGGSGRLLS
jgi:hypothetical protein